MRDPNYNCTMTLDKKNYMPAQPDNITLTHIYTPCLVIDNRKTTRLLINFRRGPNNQLAVCCLWCSRL